MKRSVSLLVVLAMIVTTFAGFATLAAADAFVINFDSALDLGTISPSTTAQERTFFYSKGETKTAGGWFGGAFPEGTTMVYTINDGAENDCGTSSAEAGVQAAVKGMVPDATVFYRFNTNFTQTLEATYQSGVQQTIKIYAKKTDGSKVTLAIFKTDLTKQVSLGQTVFYEGDPITVTYKNASAANNDWLCIYKDPEEGQSYGPQPNDYISEQFAYIDGSGQVVFNDPENKVTGNNRTATTTDTGGQDIIVYNKGSLSTLAPGKYHAVILGGDSWYDVECEKVEFEVIPKTFVTAENGDYTVDLSKLADVAGGWGAHGYPDLKTKMMGYNDTLTLGLFDLTGFDSVEVTYATDLAFKAKQASMSVISCFALMSADVSVGFGDAPDYLNKDKIVAKGDCTDASILNPEGANWDKGERTAIIDVSNVDYQGELFLAHFCSTGNTSLVVKIKFIAKTQTSEKTISTNKTTYAVGEPIKVTYNGAVRENSDWLCIYAGAESTYGEPGGPTSIQYAYIGGDGTIIFNDINNKVSGNDRTALHASLDTAYNETDKIFYQVQSTADTLVPLAPGTYHVLILGGGSWYDVESSKVVFTVEEGPINVTSLDEISLPGEYKLAGDIAGTLVIENGEYTIDLNGFTWDGGLSIKGGNVTISDSSEDKTGVITSSTADVIELPAGSTAEVILNEIMVIGNVSECDGVFVRAGKVTINNCFISAMSSAVQNRTSAGQIIINGGMYVSKFNALKVRDGGTIELNGRIVCIGELLIHNNEVPFEEAYIVNSSLYMVSETVEDPELGTIKVTAFYVIGDVDGDDKVDGTDVTLLLQYLAEWDVEIDELNADVNCDGVVDGKDATLLLQYMADWEVELGPQTAA